MTVLLLRHGRSTATTAGVLAGRSAGVELDEKGREQAEQVVARLSALPVVAVVASPMIRCQQTVAPLAAARALEVLTEDRLAEVDYGAWTGRAIKDLGKEPLWSVVQQHPSAAVFPGGEGLAAVQLRAVSAVRQHDLRLLTEHGHDVLWVACTHGDVIKSILADALGSHLDSFQRIVADPCSVSAVRYSPTRPFVLRTNDTGGDLSGLVPPPPVKRRAPRKKTGAPAVAPGEPDRGSSDATIGGSTGA
ncbi:MAG: histidine phosphatase family protein [Mycobacteriaceae bacterium]